MAGDSYFSKVLRRQSATAVGTGAGASATVTGVAASKLYATSIQCSSDAAALVTVESPSGTVLYNKRFSAAFTMSDSFPPGALQSATAGASMLVKVSASTSNSEANIQTHAIAG